MPDLVALDQHRVGNFSYSAAKIGDLESTEYTLAHTVFDESGTTAGFAALMNKCAQEIVKSCRKSPRVDCLMYRTTAFGTQVRQVHGYKLLQNCNVDDYANMYQNGGQTALYDATSEAIAATRDYAAKLAQQHYSVNAVLFVITDGDDNHSTLNENQVKQALMESIRSESLESLVTILIGVNIQDPYMKQKLESYAQNVGFTQFIMLEDASEKTLAKLAQFVSKSISSQSQALGTGGPSKSLTF